MTWELKRARRYATCPEDVSGSDKAQNNAQIPKKKTLRTFVEGSLPDTESRLYCCEDSDCPESCSPQGFKVHPGEPPSRSLQLCLRLQGAGLKRAFQKGGAGCVVCERRFQFAKYLRCESVDKTKVFNIAPTPPQQYSKAPF